MYYVLFDGFLELQNAKCFPLRFIPNLPDGEHLLDPRVVTPSDFINLPLPQICNAVHIRDMAVGGYCLIME